MPYIDDEFIQNLKQQLASSDPLHKEESDEAQDAFLRIEQLALGCEKASKPLRARLMREGFSEHAVDQALQRAIRCSLVDDLRYGAALVRTRINTGKGLQAISIELERLDIFQSPAELCPEYSFDEEAELERALTQLNKRPPTSKNKREGAYRKLISKGYTPTIATRASRIWHEQI